MSDVQLKRFRQIKVSLTILLISIGATAPISSHSNIQDIGQASSYSVDAPIVFPPPIASFIFAPSSPTVDTQVSFDASASRSPAGSITAYSWLWNDGTPQRCFFGGGNCQKIQNHFFDLPGSFPVTLIVTDNTGQTASITSTVTVTPVSGETPPAARFTVTPTFALLNQPISFDATASRDPDGDSITAYNWNFGDGTNGQGVTTTHSYSTVGTYPVFVTVTDISGHVSQTNMGQRIIVTRIPYVSGLNIGDYGVYYVSGTQNPALFPANIRRANINVTNVSGTNVTTTVTAIFANGTAIQVMKNTVDMRAGGFNLALEVPAHLTLADSPIPIMEFNPSQRYRFNSTGTGIFAGALREFNEISTASYLIKYDVITGLLLNFKLNGITEIVLGHTNLWTTSHTYLPGVKPGDKNNYRVEPVSWTSSNGLVSMPADLKLLASIDRINNEFTDVSGSKVTTHETIHYRNGTTLEATILIDVATSDIRVLSGKLPFNPEGSSRTIAGNLNAGDHLSENPFSPTLNATVTRNVLGVDRSVNLLNTTFTYSPTTTTTGIAWDKASGIIVGVTATETVNLGAAGTGHGSVSIVLSYTNIWQPDQHTENVNVQHGEAHEDDTDITDVSVSITGSDSADGTMLTITTQHLKNPSVDVSSLQLLNGKYYDVKISGTRTGNAKICIKYGDVHSGIGMGYWTGSKWESVSNFQMTSNTVCGTIAVSALTGTFIVVGYSSSQPAAPASPFNLGPYALIGGIVAGIAIVGGIFGLLMRTRKKSSSETNS